MHLSEIGKIVKTEWVKTVEIRPDMNIELDAFVVMPNHFHGVIIIGENEFNKRRDGGVRMDDRRLGDDERCRDDRRCGDRRRRNDEPRRNDDEPRRRDAMHCVSTAGKTTTPRTNTANVGNANDDVFTGSPNAPKPPKNKFGPQRKNLASIIRGFKSAVTMRSRIIDPGFGWQPRYHDHIIRNTISFYRIRQYIINNPVKWENDTFYGK